MHDDLAWFSRRAFLIAGVSASASTMVNGDTPASCSVASEETAGPYYVDRRLLRQDITEGKPGLRLKLQLTVLESAHCTPVANAALDIWHCDASGIYSGYTAGGAGGMRGMPPPGLEHGFGRGPTDNKTFFRGIQLTDKDGCVEFTTIYPGWYVGRDTHIHMRVRIGGTANSASYSGSHVCHTGQLYFPDDVSDTIAKIEPYAQHRAPRTRHEDDDIYTDQDGQGSIVDLKQISDQSLSDGMIASAVIVVNPQATPRELSMGGPRAAGHSALEIENIRSG